jgi:hypothetical protein
MNVAQVIRVKAQLAKAIGSIQKTESSLFARETVFAKAQ